MRSKIIGRPDHEIKREVTALALRHHLVSPFTSLVAVEVTPARPGSSELSQKVLKSEPVAGIAARSIPMAQTALGIEWRLLGGLILIVFGSLLWLTRRMREQLL
jgi:Ca-activated chloride channel family protein